MENNKRQITVVIGLIKDRVGRILLQKRSDPLIPDAHERWEFPGGRIDYGENPENALKRECLEEIGCEIRIKRLLPAVQSKVWTRSDNREQHVIILCYEAEITKGEAKPMDLKVIQVNWFSNEQINKLNTLAGIKDFVRL